MREAFGEHVAGEALVSSEIDPAGTVTVDFAHLKEPPFEVTTDVLVDLAVGLYTDARNDRSAGYGGAWAVGFQEARLLLNAHRAALTPEQLQTLRQRLEKAGYYQAKELRDPFDLGPLGQDTTERT